MYLRCDVDVGTGVNSKVVSLEEVKDILIIAKKPPAFSLACLES